jgi:3'-phosphoadenosine 5'-phosphosulfate sulfotransferase (PAPS reductase)/FAD synthetase
MVDIYKAKQIVNLSGGKDSTAMLLMMLERGEPITKVVYVDLGWDFPAMQDHIGKLQSDTGLSFVRLDIGEQIRYNFAERPVNSKKVPPHNGYGWAWPGCRWCTSLKTKAINKYLKENEYDYSCIGIAVGEERRVKDAKKQRYPLIEYGVTEKEALLYCRNRGYDWSGLYDVFDRVSCFCCPFQKRVELINLKKYYPELYERMREMDSQLNWRCTFKEGLSFSEYDMCKVDNYIITK